MTHAKAIFFKMARKTQAFQGGNIGGNVSFHCLWGLLVKMEGIYLETWALGSEGVQKPDVNLAVGFGQVI